MTELFPSFDGIAEMRVSEVNNSAEYGGISDVTTISKGGTNQYHGSLFENHQNSAFAARNTFSAQVPKLIMNDFGASFGGPLSIPKLYNGKDKTFFFMDWESLRLPFQQVLVENVPSLPLRSGDLSVYGVVRDLNGNPFPNSQIPASRYQSGLGRRNEIPLPAAQCGPCQLSGQQLCGELPDADQQRSGGCPRRPEHHVPAIRLCRFTYKLRQNAELAVRPAASNNLNGSALGGSY